MRITAAPELVQLLSESTRSAARIARLLDQEGLAAGDRLPFIVALVTLAAETALVENLPRQTFLDFAATLYDIRRAAKDGVTHLDLDPEDEP